MEKFKLILAAVSIMLWIKQITSQIPIPTPFITFASPANVCNGMVHVQWVQPVGDVFKYELQYKHPSSNVIATLMTANTSVCLNVSSGKRIYTRVRARRSETAYTSYSKYTNASQQFVMREFSKLNLSVTTYMILILIISMQ